MDQFNDKSKKKKPILRPATKQKHKKGSRKIIACESTGLTNLTGVESSRHGQPVGSLGSSGLVEEAGGLRGVLPAFRTLPPGASGRLLVPARLPGGGPP